MNERTFAFGEPANARSLARASCVSASRARTISSASEYRTCKLLRAFDIKCVPALAAVRSHVLRFDSKFRARAPLSLSLSLSRARARAREWNTSSSMRLRSLAARCLRFAVYRDCNLNIRRRAAPLPSPSHRDSAQFILIVVLAPELHPVRAKSLPSRLSRSPAYFIGALALSRGWIRALAEIDIKIAIPPI